MRRCFITVFVSLAFLLLVGMEAQGQYTRPTSQAPDYLPPTYSDLLSYEGTQNTLAVQIVNLTPYNIRFNSSSITPADEAKMLDRDRNNQKSFMFAPVGVPNFIPRAPCQVDPTDPCFDPYYINNVTRPYSMVFAWDDDGGYVVDNWVKWTIEGVKYCNGWYNTVTHECGVPWSLEDVDLGLWMYRIHPPQTQVKSHMFSQVVEVLLSVFKMLSIVTEPENPKAWIEAFLGANEFRTTILDMDLNGISSTQEQEFDGSNSLTDTTDRMYLASYVIPNVNSYCGTHLGCYPETVTSGTTDPYATDAVSSDWKADKAGPAEATLEITAHLLRGQAAPVCPSDHDFDYQVVGNCQVGRVPILMITVMTVDQWDAANLAATAKYTSVVGASLEGRRKEIRLFLLRAGAGGIRALLHRYGRPGLRALLTVIRQQLTPEQHEVLREMLKSMGSGRRPTQQERKLVHFIATALKKLLKG